MINNGNKQYYFLTHCPPTTTPDFPTSTARFPMFTECITGSTAGGALFTFAFCLQYHSTSVLIFPRSSSTMSSGKWKMNSALRAAKSRLFIRSASITPPTSHSSGKATSNGYPFTCEVIGQNSASPTFALYAIGETATAGLRPACSCPACGENVNHTISPLSGA